VEVQDHRPRGPPANATSRGGPFITPSQNANAAHSAPQPAVAPSKEPPRVYRTLLRHTEQSLWHDFGHLAENSNGEFTDWMGIQVEGGLMVYICCEATTNALVGHATTLGIRSSECTTIS